MANEIQNVKHFYFACDMHEDAHLSQTSTGKFLILNSKILEFRAVSYSTLYFSSFALKNSKSMLKIQKVPETIPIVQ